MSVEGETHGWGRSIDWSNIQHYALFSGGHDSLASVHYAMEQDSTSAVLHLDTGTGIDENLEFVRNTCAEFEWPLRIIETPEDYEEFVKQVGFPGPGVHHWAYQRLKERQLVTVASEGSAAKHYWTGIRASESQRRMEFHDDPVDRERRERWVWVNPIHAWSDEDVEEYIDEYDLPRNPVVDLIHRSGECFCGAFAKRDEELVDLQANYPQHYEWLMDVEEEVREARGENETTSYWGHGEESSDQLQRLAKEYEELDMKLCRDCVPDVQPPEEW